MAETSLEIVATTQQDKKLTTTVSYVNASASAGTLKQFGQMLNGFTTNTYDESIRVQKIHVDTEEVPVPAPPAKTTPTLTLSKGSANGYVNYTYNGDGILAAVAKDDWQDYGYVIPSQNTTPPAFIVVQGTDKSPANEVAITVVASEGENYAPATVSGTFSW